MTAAAPAETGAGDAGRLRLARYALLAILIGAVFYWFDAGALLAGLARIKVRTVAACVGLELAFYLLESWRIRRLAAGLYPFGTVLRSRLVSAFAGTFLPGVLSGEVVRVFLLDRHRPGRKLQLALLLLANRIYGVIALPGLWFVALCLDRDQVAQSFGFQALPMTAAAGLAVLTSPLLFSVRGGRRLMAGTVRRLPRPLRRVGCSVYMAGKTFTGPRLWAMATSTSVICSAMVVAEFWLISRDLGLPVDFAAWCLWLPGVALASALPVGLGAIGPQDAAMVAAAHYLGLPKESMLAVSVAIHGLRFAGTLPGIVFAGDLLRVPRRRRAPINPGASTAPAQPGNGQPIQ